MHRSSSPRDTVLAYVYVTLQAVLLFALVLWRPPSQWSQAGWIDTVGVVLNAASALYLVVGFVNLGRSLSAVPLPVEHGRLVSSGLYRWSRHPIYTGVLGLAFSTALTTQRWGTLGVAVALTLVLSVKARFEERHLAEAYPDYVDYAMRTPRFLPLGGLRR